MRNGLLRTSFATAIACSLFVAWPARAAEPAKAQLDYAAEDPNSTCASEADLRRKVAVRLGYDPFSADATWAFVVRVDARRKPVRAEIRTVENGKPAGKRALEDARCDALSDTIASTLAIAIDPVAAAPHSAPSTPTPTPAQAPPPAPAPAPAPPEAPQETPSPPLLPYAYLDGVVGFGRTAGTTLGARIGFGVRVLAFSLVAEGRGEATPGDVKVTPVDSTSWSAFSGALVPCGHKGVFELCGFFSLGSLQAKAEDVTRPSLKGTFFGSIGARVGVEIPLSPEIALRANGELGVPLVRNTFIIGGQPAWTASAVEGTLGVGVEARFR